MGPTSRISEMLKISQSEATKYCEEVRSISGLGDKLHYKTIAQYLVRYISENPSTQRMAELLRTPLPRIPSKKQLLRKKRLAAKKPKYRSARTPLQQRQITKEEKRVQRILRESESGSTSSPRDLVRTSIVDHQRVSPEKMAHCPHGVPLFKVCAICDPEKFREMNGFD